MTKQSFWGKRFLRSMVTSSDVKLPELLIGYFIGPSFAMLINGILACFLTAYYTDILGFSNHRHFLSMLMIVSAVLVVISNLVTGLLIDRVKTIQGRARPLILISGPITMLSGILIFAVPTGNELLKFIWVAISYNLFFAFAHAIYVTSHNSMVSLSTRDSQQRGMLSVCAGIVPAATIGFAQTAFALLRDYYLDVNAGGNQARWIAVMTVVSVLAMIGTLLEYYFTRERITEENGSTLTKRSREPETYMQVRAVLSDRYWWMLILLYFVVQFCGVMKNQSMVYYCNFVLNGNGVMSILSAVAAIPMILGTFVVWPLAKRFGKRNLMITGLVISILGGAICWVCPASIPIAITGLIVKGIGLIPITYTLLAMFADVLDNLEWKHHLRADGFAMSVYSSIMLAMPCIITGTLTFLLGLFQYDAVSNATGQALNSLYVNCFYGVELVGNVICVVILLFYDLEKFLPSRRDELMQQRIRKVL